MDIVRFGRSELTGRINSLNSYTNGVRLLGEEGRDIKYYLNLSLPGTVLRRAILVCWTNEGSEILAIYTVADFQFPHECKKWPRARLLTYYGASSL